MTVRRALNGKFTSADFRKELTRIMLGYQWTVHKSDNIERLVATGIRSSGFNRLSTLSVVRITDGHGYDLASYNVRSAGFGRHAPWLGTYEDRTLARALRGLQDHYLAKSNSYHSHAVALQRGRQAEGGAE